MKTADPLSEIYLPISESLQQVPASILGILKTSNDFAEDICKYFFSGQGKLLRPALTLLGAELKGVSSERRESLIRLAASFEIFHGATLVHDDIIDSSYLRRNIPTLNAKWGPQVAVLAGDYLHDRALGEIFAQSTREMFALFLKTAGLVCDGEIHEIKEKGNFDLSKETYLQIIEKKTAVLLACSLKCGALFSGASEREAEALWSFGIYFGMAFQIVDDCLDFSGNTEEFGKTLGVDFSEGVLTLPVILLLQAMTFPQREEWLETFRKNAKTEHFSKTLHLLEEKGALDQAIAQARQWSCLAKKELQVFPTSPAKQSLEALLDYVTQRSR